MSDKEEPTPSSSPETSPDDPAAMKLKVLAARKAQAQADERARVSALEDAAPECVNTWTIPGGGQEIVCAHKLVRHDPCSLCPCQGFRAANGDDATAASAALRDERPELFGVAAPAGPTVQVAASKGDDEAVTADATSRPAPRSRKRERG
jgi:hypothetical protein